LIAETQPLIFRQRPDLRTMRRSRTSILPLLCATFCAGANGAEH